VASLIPGNLRSSRGDLMDMTTRPRSRLHRVACLASIAGLLGACGGGDGGTATLPDVEITPLAGGAPVSLADIQGPAVVNLWATWCTPCRTEIPDFEAVHRERGDEVRFVGINIGEDADQAGEFLAEVGATYDQYLDLQGYVSTDLEAPNLPVTVVVDADGTIATRHLGAMDQDALEAAIDEVVGA
jgi:cytochrome c biogenesis protein CcmG, thiol:disulfide interchange protein DsbE